MKKSINYSNIMLIALFGLVFTSCSKDSDDDPLVVSPASMSMHYEDTKQLVAEGATSWFSNDEFVAKVDAHGLVTANHVGTTDIIVSNGKKSTKCEVTVTPEYYLYDDPILNWGASMSSIQSAEKHEKSSSTSSTTLYYNYTFGSNPCVMGYIFENGKLNSVLAMMDNSLFLRAGYYLIERFQPVAIGDNNDYYFIDAMEIAKSKTVVYFTTYKSGKETLTTIMYKDASQLNAASSRSILKSDKESTNIQEEMIKIMKRLL